MALLVVVVLGVPRLALAGQPSVNYPAGPQSGGVFTGPYTFATYIRCTSGAEFPYNYTQDTHGTNTYAFYGTPDGSLKVYINGGGPHILISCGNPVGAESHVVSYTITRGTASTSTPTPTPTPKKTSAPKPTVAATYAPGAAIPTPTLSSAPTPATNTTTTPSPTASPSPPPGSAPAAPTPPSKPEGPNALSLIWLYLFFGLASLILLIPLLRIKRVSDFFRHHGTRLWLRIEPYWFRFRRTLLKPVHIHGRHEAKRPGLAHYHHTGKVLARHHTSYASLAFLILLTTVLTAAISWSTKAESSLLTLTVTGPPPSTAATITDPSTGDTFTTSTQTIRGSCPTGLFVEIWRNGTFAGSTVCDINGLFAVLITLTPGQNDLIARDRDALGQYGPDSATVTVYYNPPPPPTPTPTPSATPAPTAAPSTPRPSPSATPAPAAPAPLLLTSDRTFYQGVDTGEPVSWTIKVSGGSAPYSTTWQWGDGITDPLHVGVAGEFKLQHSYSDPGFYQVTIRAKDAAGHEAVIQLMVVVSGEGTPATFGSVDKPGVLIFIWPLISLISLITISFWLGERHELSQMRPFLRFTRAT